MIYLIGGAARAGKSTLARTLLERLPRANYLSGDSLRQALKPILPKFRKADIDNGSIEAYIDYYRDHAKLAVDEIFERSESVWPFIERYIDSYKYESDNDLVVDSVDIWPHSINRLELPHRAVFIVDTDSEQWRRIVEHMGPNDWMTAKGLTSEQIKAWAYFNALRSQRVVSEATQFRYGVFDVADLGFTAAQNAAIDRILI